MAGMNPLNWTAAPFLTLYGGLAVVLLAALFWGRGRVGRGLRGRGGGNGAEGLNPVQLAYLAGGRTRAVDTVLVGLFELGVLRVDETGKKYLAGAIGRVPGWLAGFEPIVPGPVARARLHKALRQSMTPMLDGLAARGLVPGADGVLNYYGAGVLGLALLAGFGVWKIDVGSARGHPVGILTVMVIATLILGCVAMFAGPVRTPAGSAALRLVRAEKARAMRAPVGDEVMLAFALAGAAVLAGRPYQPFFASSGSGGDGAGSAGGDGGGGCGGGCGGCSD